MKIDSNNRIIELPQSVADKIAAGEVVDRPLSVIKELVENAIDSGASAIVIEFKNGGSAYMRVTDNGCGIDAMDAELAFKRHATSKIRTAFDLERIQTLGFRGEALSSICAVSQTELITKTAYAKAGFRILFSGGLISEKSEIGCPDGTTVVVQNLFFNTPARLKFMKSEASETALIIDFLSKIAIAYPEIKIRLINNANLVFATTGRGDVYENIMTVLSADLGKNLIHIKQEDSDYSLEAYISVPSYTQASRKNQIFFVNGRSISSKIIEQAVSTAYRERIFERRYPAAFIFFHLPPEQLDVNIHPNKKEVRFEEEARISQYIEQAIKNGLSTLHAVPEVSSKGFFVSAEVMPREKQAVEQLNIKQLLSDKPISNPGRTIQHDRSLAKEEKGIYKQIPFNVLDLTITGSIFDTYITAIDDAYFYLIDQHAAHERVFYEAMLSAYHHQTSSVQSIMTPFMVYTASAIDESSADWLSVLRSLGYDLDLFGPKAYRVCGIPLFMSLGEAQGFLNDFIETVSENMDYKDLNKIEKIISHACQSAVKAHDHLDMKEMQQLLLDLSKTDNPGSCPHGRPVYIKLGKHEIEKLFKRI